MNSVGLPVACSVFFSGSEAHIASSAIRGATGEVPIYVSTSSISGFWPSVAEKRTFGTLSLRSPHGEVYATYATSQIAYLYAEAQDVEVASPRSRGFTDTPNH